MHIICNLSCVPIRKSPSDESEMISQMIFGELAQLIEYGDRDWIKIQLENDNYIGWIDAKQVKKVSEGFVKDYRTSNDHLITSSLGYIEINNLKSIITFGSILPFFHHNTFKIEEDVYSYSEIDAKDGSGSLDLLISKFLNVPYLWGGKSFMGIDCSGFTQVVLKILGCQLPRDAYQQAELGQTIDLKNAQKGDLAFFSNPKGRIIHVGIVLDDQTIVHASGKVRIDTLDEKGIWNEQAQKYSHNLASVKRVIGVT